MISIVIPSYNRKECTLRLLESIFLQDEEFEVIVVDDKSTDDTNECIRLKYPEVILIENDVNSGPAVSRNKGFSLEFLIIQIKMFNLKYLKWSLFLSMKKLYKLLKD